MSFSPLPPIATRVDACADALRTAILGGRFPAGQRLPAERELASQFGVTRVTLRGALARLAARGLVHAHQGRGTVVCDYQASGGPDLIGALMATASVKGPIYRDLLAVRRALAGVVLERLAATTPSLEAIHHAIEDFADAVESSDVEAMAAADLAVLRALLDATDSAVLRLCLNPILRVLQGAPDLRAAIYRNPAENLAGWRALAVWLQHPDEGSVAVLQSLLAARDRETLAALEPSR